MDDGNWILYAAMIVIAFVSWVFNRIQEATANRRREKEIEARRQDRIRRGLPPGISAPRATGREPGAFPQALPDRTRKAFVRGLSIGLTPVPKRHFRPLRVWLLIRQTKRRRARRSSRPQW